jgi:hypothetical protein
MIVIDDFVKDHSLLNDIENDSTFFSQNSQYMWWDGWWNSPANTLKKRLIKYIWGEYSPMSSIETSGFEYWTGQYGEGSIFQGLNPHFDKDESLWDETKTLSTPIIGTVFYPIKMDIDGGYLEIHSKEGDLPERIQAKFNRLIIFDAGNHAHQVTDVTRGLRSAIAINLWKTPPSGLYNQTLIYEQ